jgi:hypothetical protein
MPHPWRETPANSDRAFPFQLHLPELSVHPSVHLPEPSAGVPELSVRVPEPFAGVSVPVAGERMPGRLFSRVLFVARLSFVSRFASRALEKKALNTCGELKAQERQQKAQEDAQMVAKKAKEGESEKEKPDQN